MPSYPALSPRTLIGAVRLCRPLQHQPTIEMDSPAIQVMTDLTRVAAAVGRPEMSVEAANLYMMHRGVRMLLVLNEQELLVGIVTSTDILGEKPVALASERGVRHSEILVADVMTPASRLDAFDLHTVEGACVGNVVASLQQSRRHHALVTQRNIAGGIEIRGIFSLSQIARQMAKPLQLPQVAGSFAEMAALMH